jgi:glycosyltransferase involved in cell wall biosynthesis
LHFLSVGRIVKDKGYLESLKFIEKLQMHGFEVTWTIVGEGEYSDEFKRMIRRSRLKTSVNFRGYLSGASLRKAYNEANIFIQLSELEESFGLVYVEAGLAGLILIGRPLGAICERINDKNGFLYYSIDEAVRFFLDGTWKNLKTEDIILNAVNDSKDTLTELICAE